MRTRDTRRDKEREREREGERGRELRKTNLYQQRPEGLWALRQNASSSLTQPPPGHRDKDREIQRQRDTNLGDKRRKRNHVLPVVGQLRHRTQRRHKLLLGRERPIRLQNTHHIRERTQRNGERERERETSGSEVNLFGRDARRRPRISILKASCPQRIATPTHTDRETESP
jgi:hypothetical protein